MKNLIIAAVVATSFTAGAAYADGLGFGGYGEYAIESETLEFGLNASYEIDALTLSTEAVFTKPNGVDLDFTEVTVGAAYALDGNVSLYTEVLFDSEFEYDEATIGVSFSF